MIGPGPGELATVTQLRSFAALWARLCAQAALLLLALFGPVGTLEWMPGRYCLRALGLGWVVSALFLWFGNRKLFLHRTSTSEQTVPWDRWILLGIQLSILGILAVASLDAGRRALPEHWPTLSVGCGLLWLGQSLFLLSLLQNPFFAVTICPQAEQKVVTTGIYAWIRHPGYLGMLIGSLGIPLMLSSAWAVLPWLCLLLLLAHRIEREEAYLESRLMEYLAYRTDTRFRLIPFLW